MQMHGQCNRKYTSIMRRIYSQWNLKTIKPRSWLLERFFFTKFKHIFVKHICRIPCSEFLINISILPVATCMYVKNFSFLTYISTFIALFILSFHFISKRSRKHVLKKKASSFIKVTGLQKNFKACFFKTRLGSCYC